MLSNEPDLSPPLSRTALRQYFHYLGSITSPLINDRVKKPSWEPSHYVIASLVLRNSFIRSLIPTYRRG